MYVPDYRMVGIDFDIDSCGIEDTYKNRFGFVYVYAWGKPFAYYYADPARR